MDISGHTVTGTHGGRALHAARPAIRPFRAAIAVLPVFAVAGALAASHSAGPTTGTPPGARLITATPQVPLPAADLAALTTRRPDFGPLGDPAACLRGLGYPATLPVLGAQRVRVAGRSAVVLVLPGRRADEIVGVAVSEDCGESRARVIADTTVRRP